MTNKRQSVIEKILDSLPEWVAAVRLLMQIEIKTSNGVKNT
jgi:hypothetical protein